MFVYMNKCSFFYKIQEMSQERENSTSYYIYYALVLSRLTTLSTPNTKELHLSSIMDFLDFRNKVGYPYKQR